MLKPLIEVAIRKRELFTFPVTIYSDMDDVHLVIKNIVKKAYCCFYFLWISDWFGLQKNLDTSLYLPQTNKIPYVCLIDY